MIMDASTRLAVFRHIGLCISVKPANTISVRIIVPIESNLLASISITLDPRDIRRRDFPSVELFPIDLVEPRMQEDIGRSAPQVSESLGEVANEQVLEQFLGGCVKVGGVADFALWKRGQRGRRRYWEASYSNNLA